jgi:hypothetical protein
MGLEPCIILRTRTHGDGAGMARRLQFAGGLLLLLAGGLVGFIAARYVYLSRDSQLGSHGGQPAEQVLGRWEVTFKPPVSLGLPEGHPIARFGFGRNHASHGYRSDVTIENLTDSPCRVRYAVYVYDSNDTRRGEYQDELALRSHESVVRNVETSFSLLSYGLQGFKPTKVVMIAEVIR